MARACFHVVLSAENAEKELFPPAVLDRGGSHHSSRRVARWPWSRAICKRRTKQSGKSRGGSRCRIDSRSQRTSRQVLSARPHAFTQGLEYYDGFLYESTGLKGKSSLRKVDVATGRVLQSVLLPPEYFGEGLTIFHGKIYQLTWLSKTGFIYDLRSFRKTAEFHFESEGWGLTHDEHSLILSDGTNQIQFIDPTTFQVQRRLEVYAEREAVVNLNELEYIDGLIYANIWHSPRIVRIDPRTGQVLAWLDLEKISAKEQREPEDVLNGIAYDREGDRLFITGKDWPELLQIKIEEK